MSGSLPEFLAEKDWKMSAGERAVLEGVLSFVKPRLAIEIGTLAGESLGCISRHSESVHSFDLVRHDALTDARFANVSFHTGDSHELLPATLAELAREAVNVDFALVDGDHSAMGVRRDLEDLLESPATQRTVILLHDTLNERVRAGIGAVPFASYEKVTLVDLDFTSGQIVKVGDEHRLWGGFGVVVTGWPIGELPRPAVDTLDVFTRCLSTLPHEHEEIPGYDAFADLELELATVRASLAKMERSLSWRITSPLRRVKHAVTRGS
jgi:hypothetical protein